MKKIFILISLGFVWLTKANGQCLTPSLVEYTAPTIIGNTSYVFKYDKVEGNQLWKGDSNFENQVLVKNLGGDDIDGSGIESFVEVNGIAYFSAEGADGRELWKSDGTTNGTVQVKDIFPGNSFYGGGKNSGFPDLLTKVNNLLFFRAKDETTSYGQWGLWKSNGSSAGTIKIADMSWVDHLIEFNSILYFVGDNGFGSELWKSDGTAAGTVAVKSLIGTGYGPNPKNLTVIGNTLFFSNASQLWKSDGTRAGTVMVKQINSSVEMSEFFNYNGTLVFNAYDNTSGRELWKSDGTTNGTTLIKDIYPGLSSSNPLYKTIVNGLLYFTAKDDTHGTELWKSDGTETGTQMVKEIYPGAIDYGYPSALYSYNGKLFFSAMDSESNGLELWTSDGSAAGTLMFKNISTTFNGSSGPIKFKNINGTLYFMANTYLEGYELWKSDGTVAGTVMVKDIYPDSNSPGIKDYVNTTNGIIFNADDGYYGNELWKTDGTSNGTQILKNIRIFYDQDKTIETSILNGQLIFTLKLNDLTFRLFKSDGTEQGTILLNETITNFYSSNYELTPVNNTLFFVADNNINGEELWKTDGTPTGTILVKDIFPSSTSLNVFPFFKKPTNLINFNGTLFFSASDPNYGEGSQELWKSDGTEAGTVLVKDIAPGFAFSSYLNQFIHVGSDLKNFVIVNNSLFFSAYVQETGRELWKTDGTEAGTLLVKDIFPGSGYANSSDPTNLTNVNGTLFFNARDGFVNNNELWKSDGTGAGTLMVKNIAAVNSQGGNPQFLNNINGTLFFVANDYIHGTELWKSDGTEAGTTIFMDLKSGEIGSEPSNVYNFNGNLFFSAYNNSFLSRLWTSDGTPSGTTEVSNSPYINYSINEPSYFKNVNGNIFFKSSATINSNNIPDQLFRLSSFSPLSINSNLPSPISSGNSVTLTLNNCTGGVVTWDNGLGTGVSKTVTPIITSTYTASCSNVGCPVSITISVSPCPYLLIIASTIDDQNNGTITKQASSNTGGKITATNKIIGTANVTYQAKSIELNAGFKADTGTVFKAEIGGCN